jgi:hypothetical protein
MSATVSNFQITHVNYPSCAAITWDAEGSSTYDFVICRTKCAPLAPKTFQGYVNIMAGEWIDSSPMEPGYIYLYEVGARSMYYDPQNFSPQYLTIGIASPVSAISVTNIGPAFATINFSRQSTGNPASPLIKTAIHAFVISPDYVFCNDIFVDYSVIRTSGSITVDVRPSTTYTFGLFGTETETPFMPPGVYTDPVYLTSVDISNCPTGYPSITFTTPQPTALPTPTIHIESTSTTSASIHIANKSISLSGKLEISSNGGSSWSECIELSPSDPDIVICDGLQPGTTYWFRFRYYEYYGYPSSIEYWYSNYSSIVNTTTNNTPVAPNAPSNLTPTAVPMTTINLSWDDNSSNETWFKVERSIEGGAWTQIATTTSPSYSNTGCTPGTYYMYRVRAYNTVGNSAYSNVVEAYSSGEV